MAAVIDKVKRHLRIPHNLEDEDIRDYIEWAENDVIEAVYDRFDENLDIEALRKDVSYKKAVIMMSSFYYENRLVISETGIQEAPFSVTHAIQLLRSHRDRYFISDEL